MANPVDDPALTSAPPASSATPASQQQDQSSKENTATTPTQPQPQPTPHPQSQTQTQTKPPAADNKSEKGAAGKSGKQAGNKGKEDTASTEGGAAAAAAATGGGGGGEKLSGAELKKRAKAEKAARRAQAAQERETVGPPGGPGGVPSTPGKKGFSGGSGAPGGAGGAGGAKDAASVQGAKGQKGNVPRRGSAQNAAGVTGGSGTAEQKKKKQEKNVAVFGHLYGQQRRTTIAGAGKELHPAVLALGLQMRDYVVCGSSARCVATLLAFKRVIEAYTTPLGTSLSRHLTTHLSHQITYLSTCRPLSISQGNAIRALKLAIASIDPSVPEATAKTTLSDFIDSFIREKITVADQVIAGSAAQKIQDGDVIVTFAGSSIVKQTLATAHQQGKKFRVSIIDSRPLFEGKNMARALANAGLDVQYSLVNGISHAIKDATKVFLGAHAMTSNGRLYSRVGTALVAMSAKERAGGVEVPVIVCCETVKFTDRVALDSIVVNEIADADELVSTQPLQQVTGLPDPLASSQPEPPKKGKPAPPAPAEPNPGLNNASTPLKNWKDTPNLQLLNIMYDVTPAEYVDMVVTEMGSLPPSAVPIVHRMSTNL